MNDLIFLYQDSIRMLEERREQLNNSLTSLSCHDVLVRIELLDEEIEDLYFALRLMDAYREA